MVKNRYFKNTLGIFAELVIAASLDVEETNPTGATSATATVLVTIAADPTPGDLITITVDGVPYTHTVPVADETTQQAHDALAALLAANTQGFVVSTHSGTTSSVFQLAWAGADKNGKTVTLAETGSSFTVAGPYTFAGGVDADAAASDDMEDFAANSNAGTIWAFWEDLNSAGRHAALVTGDTTNPANANRKYFYAWKDANGLTKTTTAIPCRGKTVDTALYNAGQVQISKIKYGGTVSATQRVHVRITDTSSTQLPYPSWEYDTPFDTDIATTLVALAVLVNAEAVEPIVSVSATTDTLTVTGLYKNRTFALSGFIETSPSQVTDASAITFPTGGTQKAKAPVGDAAMIAELAEYYNIYSGGINYAPEGTRVSEFQDESGSNKTATSQWGIIMVRAPKVEAGVVYDHTSKAYVIICVPTASAAALAAL